MKRLILAFTAVVAFAGSVSAQTTINNTTLTANMTATQTTINITSATCTGCTFGQGTLIYVDSEAMLVTGAYSSGVTNIPVLRGQYGTFPAAHLATVAGTSNPVFLGPPARFHTAAGDAGMGANPPAGSCTRASQQFLPWINTRTGAFWTCDNYNWRVLYNYQINNTAASRPTSY